MLIVSFLKYILGGYQKLSQAEKKLEPMARVGRPQTSSSSPPPPPRSNFIAGRPKAALLFLFFSDFDVACCYLWLFSLYINIKIGRIVVKC